MRQPLAAGGLAVVELPTRTGTCPCPPMSAALQAGRNRHTGNRVLKWGIGKVVGHYDARRSFYPRKAHPEQKIDAAVALVMALGRAISGQADKPDERLPGKSDLSGGDLENPPLFTTW
jgi:phage terminase large subunit-like protein